jgi:predicted nucleic acid-binding protein
VRVALDTNILVYAEGVNGASKKLAALEILDRLAPDSVVLPVQTLGELFQVLVRKAGRSPAQARAAVLSWRNAFAVVATSPGVLLAATDLTLNQFSIWDAVILCTAAEANCQLLLSEDMQDGFVWQGVTIVNPLRQPAHPLLQHLLHPAP